MRFHIDEKVEPREWAILAQIFLLTTSTRPPWVGYGPLPPAGRGGVLTNAVAFSPACSHRALTRAFRYPHMHRFRPFASQTLLRAYSAGNAMLRSAGARQGYRNCCNRCERDQNGGMCGWYRPLPHPASAQGLVAVPSAAVLGAQADPHATGTSRGGPVPRSLGPRTIVCWPPQ